MYVVIHTHFCFFRFLNLKVHSSPWGDPLSLKAVLGDDQCPPQRRWESVSRRSGVSSSHLSHQWRSGRSTRVRRPRSRRWLMSARGWHSPGDGGSTYALLVPVEIARGDALELAWEQVTLRSRAGLHDGTDQWLMSLVKDVNSSG